MCTLIVSLCNINSLWLPHPNDVILQVGNIERAENCIAKRQTHKVQETIHQHSFAELDQRNVVVDMAASAHVVFMHYDFINEYELILRESNSVADILFAVEIPVTNVGNLEGLFLFVAVGGRQDI